MKVLFLCGGSSNRMFPVTRDKFLLNFLGKPLLQHQVEMAQKAGFNQFIFVGNKNNLENIRQLINSLPRIEAEFVLQQNPKGIADALISARPFLNEAILVISPNDVFTDSAYNKIVQANNQASQSVSSMLGYQVKEYFPGGYLDVDSKANLKHIVEKPGKGNEPSNLVNILVHLHRNPQKLLEYINVTESTFDDVYERSLDKMANEGHLIKIIPYADFWAPIKYPWHIFRVMEHYLDNLESYISDSAHVSDRAIINGNVILSDNVRVMENAVIKGPAYIGPNSIIGNNTLLRGYCHIGANSVVGYSTEIKHCYIGDNCWFHSNYVGDSIIESNCSFGSGAITANFRLDETNIHVNINHSKIDTGYDKLGAIVGSGCRIGINANLMPGIRVGSNCLVGPHVCLNEDLMPNKRAMSMAHQYKVTDNFNNSEQNKRQKLLNNL